MIEHLRGERRVVDQLFDGRATITETAPTPVGPGTVAVRKRRGDRRLGLLIPIGTPVDPGQGGRGPAVGRTEAAGSPATAAGS